MSFTGIEQAPMTNGEYTKNAGLCPFCRSSNIEGGNFNIDGNTASQDVSCNDCDKEWADTYALTGYQET